MPNDTSVLRAYAIPLYKQLPCRDAAECYSKIVQMLSGSADKPLKDVVVYSDTQTTIAVPADDLPAAMYQAMSQCQDASVMARFDYAQQHCMVIFVAGIAIITCGSADTYKQLRSLIQESLPSA